MARWTIAAILLAFATQASAAFIVRVGDVVYVDGKKYDWAEWKKIRDTYQPASAAPATPGQESLAATCVTSIYYDEFPSDDERFQCSAGLGSMTRDEILRRGWKVDLIEKIPPPAGNPSQSPRGLPLSLYRLVISRSGAPVPGPQPAGTPVPQRVHRTSDMLCMQDCEGTGGTRGFCEDRCTN
jgi:hypothetical protein